jgi:NADPH2:quinone reductase
MDTHRTWRCHAFGDYHQLSFDRVPTPAPAAREVRIEVHAATVAFHEMLMVQGLYQLKPPLPFTPGSEAAGVVTRVGADVTRFKPGDKVIGAVRHGAHTEVLTVDEAQCLALPAPFDFATGAAFLTAYKTAYVALVPRGGLRPGETLLVHGAAGGVGLAAVELGKVLGARVIAAASSDAKLALAARMGADALVDTREPRFREAVRELTGGRGADVIYDPVGGDVFDESLHCIAPFGRLLVIGFAAGRIPTLAVNYALIKQFSVVGVRAGEYGRVDPVAGAHAERGLLDIAERGLLHPHVHGILPLAELPQAFDQLAQRAVTGRLVLATEAFAPEAPRALPAR